LLVRQQSMPSRRICRNETADVRATDYHQLTDTGKARRLRPLATAALARFGIHDAELRQVAIHTNFLFRVTTAEGRFALRIQRPGLHSPVETDLEVWWVRQLAADGLPVANVIAATGGESVVTVGDIAGVPEEHRCVLFEWLPGSEPDEEEVGLFHAFGELAARLHDHASGLSLPSHLPDRRWDAAMPYEESILFEPRFADVITPPRRRVLEAGLERLDAALAATYNRPDRPILLHGDLHNGNVRRYHGRLTVFDFEDVIVGHPMHDIAVALYGSYYNAPNYREFLAAMRAGYESVRSWPLADDAELVPLFAARALGMINFCLFNGGDFLDYVPRLTDRVGAFLDS
jgi:Ser/Thr protein kinase RdoA (MazF antagonist)